MSKYCLYFAVMIDVSMEIIRTNDSLRRHLDRFSGAKIGFVPTMGALHKGHLELVKRAKQECDIVVASIFVNPKQFNKQGDFDNYPNFFERDVNLLEQIGCDVLYNPSTEEVYPRSSQFDEQFDFGQIDKLMEGEHRPGHFNGVAQVIKRFFDIIEPSRAYFGEKDFQQLAVVRALVKQLNSKVEVVGCPTVREASGLAMSSRNERLTPEEKQAAAVIFSALDFVSKNKANYSLQELKDHFYATVDNNIHLTTEYFEIADANTLVPLSEWQEGVEHRAFTAVNIRDVRLIDNVAINH